MLAKEEEAGINSSFPSQLSSKDPAAEPSAVQKFLYPDEEELPGNFEVGPEQQVPTLHMHWHARMHGQREHGMGLENVHIRAYVHVLHLDIFDAGL